MAKTCFGCNKPWIEDPEYTICFSCKWSPFSTIPTRSRAPPISTQPARPADDDDEVELIESDSAIGHWLASARDRGKEADTKVSKATWDKKMYQAVLFESRKERERKVQKDGKEKRVKEMGPRSELGIDPRNEQATIRKRQVTVYLSETGTKLWPLPQGIFWGTFALKDQLSDVDKFVRKMVKSQCDQWGYVKGRENDVEEDLTRKSYIALLKGRGGPGAVPFSCGHFTTVLQLIVCIRRLDSTTDEERVSRGNSLGVVRTKGRKISKVREEEENREESIGDEEVEDKKLSVEALEEKVAELESLELEERLEVKLEKLDAEIALAEPGVPVKTEEELVAKIAELDEVIEAGNAESEDLSVEITSSKRGRGGGRGGRAGRARGRRCL